MTNFVDDNIEKKMYVGSKRHISNVYVFPYMHDPILPFPTQVAYYWVTIEKFILVVVFFLFAFGIYSSTDRCFKLRHPVTLMTG